MCRERAVNVDAMMTVGLMPEEASSTSTESMPAIELRAIEE